MATTLRNILILNYEYPPLGGGAGVISRYHAEGLAKKGIKVTVITAWFQGQEEISHPVENLTLIRVKSKRKYDYKSDPIEMLSWVKKAWEYLKNQPETYELTIAHFSIPAGIVARRLKKQMGTPFWVVSHGQDLPGFFPKQMLKFHVVTYFWIKSILKASERLIVQTNHMQRNALRYLRLPQDKVTIIPNGCDVDFFKPDFSKKSKRFTILFVGRLVGQKGPMVFLKAIKRLDTLLADVDFQVKVIGDGPMRPKMEAFVQKQNLEKRFLFTGWISKEELLHEYQSASLQVMTSYDEGMSIAALESLSTGLYMVSTPASGQPDVIEDGENGVLVEFGDDQGVAEAVGEYYSTVFIKTNLIETEELNSFREKYQWNNIVTSYLNLIKQSLG